MLFAPNMRIYLTNLNLHGAEDDPHQSLSRVSSENGVSSRMEACRKRLRMTRANQKGPIEQVEPARISVTCSVEVYTEMSRSPGVVEVRGERLDEAGIT